METYWVVTKGFMVYITVESQDVLSLTHPLRLGCALELSYMLLVTINSSENQRASKMTWTKTTKLCTRHHFRTPCYYGFTIETDRSVDRGTFNSQKKKQGQIPTMNTTQMLSPLSRWAPAQHKLRSQTRAVFGCKKNAEVLVSFLTCVTSRVERQ